tara:strand:- start:7784 stop:8224 length:441 start_codon:yes stop_codon:yes gene_type:complete
LGRGNRQRQICLFLSENGISDVNFFCYLAGLRLTVELYRRFFRLAFRASDIKHRHGSIEKTSLQNDKNGDFLMFFPARMMTELFVSEFFGRRLCVWVVNSCKDYVNVALSFTIRIHAMLCGLQWFAGEDRGAIQKEATRRPPLLCI